MKKKIECKVFPSNIDEESVKKSLLKGNIDPELISKNLAELKANKISLKFYNEIVLGADSVIDIDKELVSKPRDREEALEILKKNHFKPIYKYKMPFRKTFEYLYEKID